MLELSTKTNGTIELSREQAKCFATSIFAEMKAYIREHRDEYAEWLAEEGGGSG